MEDFYIDNISQMESNDSYFTFYYDYDYNDTNSDYKHTYNEPTFFNINNEDVITYVIISIGLPLTLLAIYSLYSQVRNDNVAPIYIINLLISDLIQLCYMIVEVAKPMDEKISEIFFHIYLFAMMASLGFMVCIALERYLVIARPLWYHFRRTIKISLVVCVVVWILPVVVVLPAYFNAHPLVLISILTILFLIPFPLLIFFLGGTLKALSAATSVPSDEKRRIVGMLVLVLLIYTLLFLPTVMLLLPHCIFLFNVIRMLLKFSPLADLILYFFIRKGVIDKLLASLCCCRMNSDDNSRSSA